MRVASMRLKVSILIPLSIILGLAAVQSGRTWLDKKMDERARLFEAQNRTKPQTFATIVVASRPLRFGNELSTASLKEIPWAAEKLPEGSFARISDLLGGNGKRLALFAMEANEPILESKITGPGQKANLAAVIEEGKKAITVRVDDVVGVAGFILPSDRVDVLLTRKVGSNQATSDNILQNVKVLAIDQKADDRLDKPTLARAVTLEVSTLDAQRLNVAQSVGTLSLILRPVAEFIPEAVTRVTSSQLSSALAPSKPPEKISDANAVVNVIRSVTRREYSVPAELK